MDWQAITAIIASVGALLISLYTAKSAVRKGDVEALSIIISQLRTRIEELETRLREYRQKIYELEEQLSQATQKIERLEAELVYYKQQYKDLKEEYDRIHKLYVRMCAFVRRLGFDPEALDEE